MSSMEASFSVLTMSIASSAAMALGLAPDPQTNKTSKDTHLAKFNIDLLVVLREKTMGNLSAEEKSFLDSILLDLQSRFIEESKK